MKLANDHRFGAEHRPHRRWPRAGAPALRWALAALALAAASPTPVAGAAGVAVAAGERHTCALTTAGAVLCWGRDEEGQLGDGGSLPGTDREVPASVSGLTSGVAEIAVGYFHSCARTTAGAVKCWGSDVFGQIGNGGSVPGTGQAAPVSVNGLNSGVAAIDAGGSHTCALTTDGGVKCWGANLYGQLGNGVSGSGQTGPAPVNVTGLSSGVLAITAGGFHTCALTAAGAVKCWGLGTSGQLGNGGSGSPTGAFLDGSLQNMATGAEGALDETNPIPVDVTGLSSGVRAISAGSFHTCALTTDGGVKCWGMGLAGQLGNSAGIPGTNQAVPVDVSGLTSGVDAIAAGGFHTCALTTDGTLKCWGSDSKGQLGDGGSIPGSGQAAPVSAIGLSSSVDAIAAGSFHTCVVTTEGTVLCWGWNENGQLGNGVPYGTDQATPVEVSLPATLCGNGSVDPGETCDGDLCCNATCDGVKPAEVTCRAAAGVCDVAETCSGLAASCPADALVAAGTTCRATAGSCDVAETCNGSAATCPSNAVAASGTTCRAEAAGGCDVAESCDGKSEACPIDAGLEDETVCRGTCGDGTCSAGVCSGVVARPRAGCRKVVSPLKSKLKILNSLFDSRDQLQWSWSQGEATTVDDLGAPTDPVHGSDYALCVYGRSVFKVPELISHARVAAGAGWIHRARGSAHLIAFTDPSGTQDGITSIRLTPGLATKAEIEVKGKGFALDTPALPLSLPTLVQLHVVDSDTCFEAIFMPRRGTLNVSAAFSGSGQ